jgi:hypothetical protein
LFVFYALDFYLVQYNSIVRFFLVLFFVFNPIFKAHSGVFIEPYLGYAFKGEGKTIFSNAAEIDHLYTSMNYGAKLGYAFFRNHLLGIDYGAQSHFLDSDQATAKASDKVSRSQLGIFYGLLIRRFILSFTHFTSATIKGVDVENTNNQVFTNINDFAKGSGSSIGIGFRYTNNVNLILQMRKFDFKELQSNGVLNANHQSTKLSDILFTISFPFGVTK